ncbi:hypothetical protein EXS61_00765 [Candidatus Parcubacteria bacterium]|nr:hypothetical protein [Candidatus Parcubacteria bacterium]
MKTESKYYKDYLKPLLGGKIVQVIVDDDIVYNRPFSESFLGVCLGLRDSIRISQTISYSVFQKIYERSSLFCLKTIVSDRKGKRFAPFLYGNQAVKKVCVGWRDTTTTICPDDVFAGYPLTPTNQ